MYYLFPNNNNNNNNIYFYTNNNFYTNIAGFFRGLPRKLILFTENGMSR